MKPTNENPNWDGVRRSLREDALQARLQLQAKYTQQVDALILKAMLSLELAYKKIGEGEHMSLTGGETRGVPYTKMNHSSTWPWGVKMQHKKALIRDTLSTLNGNKPYLK
jgi:hypothetical protein